MTELTSWRSVWRESNKILVVTNGCFDLLHPGHVLYLEEARNLGDGLLVGLNSDESVRRLKGPDRPVVGEQDRAVMLAGLACVDGVCIFNEINALRLLEVSRPDLYVKGGDYTWDTLNPDERQLLERLKIRIVLGAKVAGQSTSNLIEKLGRNKIVSMQ
jgi:D-beta-D-heptose 7-phosphate kinase/D-beta-D-heptose 1-phosphate adenosyltransferase